MKLILAIIEELQHNTDNAVLSEFLDEGDAGNLIGMVIGKHLDVSEIIS